MSDANRFHAHLDVCAQCRNNPMFLCVTGARLLRREAEGERRLEGTPFTISAAHRIGDPKCDCSMCAPAPESAP